MNQDQILDLYEKELAELPTSVFAPYKKTKNLYENLLNCLAVDLEIKRGGDASKCRLEEKWKDFKVNKFPREEMEEVIKRAFKKIRSSKQTKIFNLFTYKRAQNTNAEEPSATEVQEIVLEPEVCLEVEGDEVKANEPEDEVSSVHFKKVCCLLGLDVKDISVPKDINVVLIAEKLLPDLEQHFDLSNKVDKLASHFQSKSDLSVKK